MVYEHISYLQRIIILDLSVAYYDTISSEMEHWGELISYPYLLLIHIPIPRRVGHTPAYICLCLVTRANHMDAYVLHIVHRVCLDNTRKRIYIYDVFGLVGSKNMLSIYTCMLR